MCKCIDRYRVICLELCLHFQEFEENEKKWKALSQEILGEVSSGELWRRDLPSFACDLLVLYNVFAYVFCVLSWLWV